MTQRITMRDLRSRTGEIMRAVEGGEEFIITRSSVPVAELVSPRRSRFVKTEVLIAALKEAGTLDYRRFRRDVGAILGDRFEPRT